MIQLTTSNGDKFEYPLWLKDVTLSKYLNFISLIEPTKPQVLKDIDKILSQMDDLEKDSKEYNEKLLIANDLFDSITDVVKAQQIYPYYARVVSYFSGLSEQYILGKDGGTGMEVKALEWLYKHIVVIFTTSVILS